MLPLELMKVCGAELFACAKSMDSVVEILCHTKFSVSYAKFIFFPHPLAVNRVVGVGNRIVYTEGDSNRAWGHRVIQGQASLRVAHETQCNRELLSAGVCIYIYI